MHESNKKTVQSCRVRGLEINTDLVGALFTDIIGTRLSVFCLYLNGEAINFDLPVENNIGSLDEMFRRFDLFKKGNSVVVDRIVRARVYVEEPKGIWMYTLLATDGSKCPIIGENLLRLPWKRVWSRPGDEILKLEHSKNGYCFAVRSQIFEGQLEHTLRETNSLLLPRMSIPSKRKPLISVTIALASVILVTGALVAFRQVKNSAQAKPAVVLARPSSPVAVVPTAQTNYFLLVNRERTGPFPLEAILKREKTGQLPVDSLIRPEQGVDWQRLDSLIQTQP